MARVARALPWLCLLLVSGWWVTPVSTQSPQTMQAVAASGTVLNRLGVIYSGSQAIGVVVLNPSTATIDSATAYQGGVWSFTQAGPFSIVGSFAVDSATVYQGTIPWSMTALTPLPVSGNFAVNSATVYQGSPIWVTSATATGPYSIVFSGTQNVLAYPTGVYATTTTGPLSIIFSGAQSMTSAGPFSIVFSTTQNVLSYPTGVYVTTTLGPQSIVFSGAQSTTQSGPFTVVQNTTARTLTGTVSTTSVGPLSIVFSGAQSTTQAGPFTVVQNATARTITGLLGSNTSMASVGSSITSVQCQAANAARVSLNIFNDSTSAMYVKYGAVASLTSFTWKLGPMLNLLIASYSGRVDCLWDAVDGNARITEVSP